MDPYPVDRAPATPGPYAASPPPYVATDPVHPRVEPAYTPPRPAWAAGTDRADFVKWAFYSGVAGGVLILLGAFCLALLMTVMSFLGGPAVGWPWMGDAGEDNSFLIALLVAVWGLFTGGAVVLGALRLKETPHASAVPGAVMLAGGILSFLVFGGFLVGGLLAIVAGVLAVAGARSVFTLRGPRLRGHDRPPSLP